VSEDVQPEEFVLVITVVPAARVVRMPLTASIVPVAGVLLVQVPPNGGAERLYVEVVPAHMLVAPVTGAGNADTVTT
jgi:hypothetical protein